MSHLLALLLAGCSGPPIGADFVGPHGSRDQVEKSAVTSGELSANSLSLLHRYSFDRAALSSPDKVLRELHAKAVATRERDLLFVLAELSYYGGEKLRGTDDAAKRDAAREYYLSGAIYAYLFLFGDAQGAPPDGFDRRFRTACEVYNYGLGMAFATAAHDGALVEVNGGTRHLPVGSIALVVDGTKFPVPVAQIEGFYVADQYRVRGLSVRNREAGLGTPLIAVTPIDESLQLKRSLPVTAFLRLEGGLDDLTAGRAHGTVELHATYGEKFVSVGNARVPLEIDLTVAQAHTLNQDEAWGFENALFFRPENAQRSQIVPSEPFQRGRVPVVLVHGTYSSPVWWAEMINTLNADPDVRERCQIWTFLYPSGQPVGRSARELRAALTAKVRELDPEGRDARLHQMVVIGHSQGGLLTRLTVTDTGDHFWQVLQQTMPDRIPADLEMQEAIKKSVHFEPLPFVRRAVFISTPHRGSYLVGGLVRNLGRWLISIPQTALAWTEDMLPVSDDAPPSTATRRLHRTSLDGMSPEDPFLLALAGLPVAPGVKAHSIIPVKGDGDYHEGKDGVVAYNSAHLDGVESEYIVRGGHSCQSMPPTIEEVRRILHEHLAAVDEAVAPRSTTPP